jgi:hypothetical protein
MVFHIEVAPLILEVVEVAPFEAIENNPIRDDRTLG